MAERRPHGLIADISRTRWCDWAGAGVLASVFRRAAAGGTELRLVLTDESVRQVIRVNGLDQGVAGLAPGGRFLRVDHLEHYPAADHLVGGRPGCTVVLRGREPADVEEATAVVRLFGLKGWLISEGEIGPGSPGRSARRRTSG